MTKYKKIATAVVATVMAGTMVFSLAACKKKGKSVAANTDFNSVAETVDVGNLKINLSADGRLAYNAGTELALDVSDSGNKERTISYNTASGIISGMATLPDGKTYAAGELKPVWKATSDYLGVGLKDVYSSTSSADDRITTPLNSTTTAAAQQIINGSLSKITEKGVETSQPLVDLSKFLDYMPNYKAFLDSNPIVKLSLVADPSTGAMYGAPYFDGNNDIEKFVLTKREWTRKMLDSSDVSAATTTFKSQATGKGYDGAVHAEAFMGTEDWSVVASDLSDKDSAKPKTTTVYVKYSKALAAAKDENTALGKAYKDAAGDVYGGNSGNIIDIMNAAITAKSGEVTGAQLLGILRAYIDVAYTSDSAGNTKFYATRSDVFNSVAAAWDVDLMTALYRCVATSAGLFGDSVQGTYYALAARDGNMQRRSDLVAYAGELFGVRGLESRYEFAYIKKDGTVADARNTAATYDALAKMQKLEQEGLIYDSGEKGALAAKDDQKIQTFSEHDYSQTQTADGFYAQGITGVSKEGVVASGDLKYDFAPILTPVSKWDTDDDGTKDTTMRFTESWRSVKNTGFCIPTASVAGNPDKLSAALNLIDYIFSNDGTIMMTFGAMSTKGNTSDADGFWYATEDTDKTEHLTAYADPADPDNPQSQYIIKDEYAKDYFVYQNKVYSGTEYNGTQIPTLTDNLKNYYYGLEVNGNKMGVTSGSQGMVYKKAFSYTDFGRGVLGACLPICNKNQGFEYQATSACGLDGSQIVGKALANGVIKHLSQTIDADNYWYTCVPTMLPITSAESTTLGTHGNLTSKTGAFSNDKSLTKNLFYQIMTDGFGTGNIAGNAALGSVPADAAGCVSWANAQGMTARLGIFQAGWNKLIGK